MGRMNLYVNENGAAEKHKTFLGQHRVCWDVWHISGLSWFHCFYWFNISLGCYSWILCNPMPFTVAKSISS